MTDPVIYMNTADVLSNAIWDSVGGGTTWAYARTGSVSWTFDYADVDKKTWSPEVSELYFRVAVLRASGNTLAYIIFGVDNDDQTQIYVDFTNSQISVYNPSPEVMLASYTMTFADKTWYTIEGHLVCHPTNGTIQIKVNGAMVIDVTGVDTQTNQTAKSTYDFIRLYGHSFAFTGYWCADDIIVRTDDWPGQYGIYIRRPASAGTYSDWSASTADAWSCVNDLPPDFADYISAAATADGYKHSFGIESLAPSVSQVAAVGVFAVAKVDSFAGTILPFVVSGGSITYQPATALTTGTIWASGFFAKDPNGSADWTPASVNAMQVGVEVEIVT